MERVAPWWSWIGALGGASLGFIIANFPGLLAGAVAGNRLGAIRDAKGKSVAVVFSQLGGDQKAEVSADDHKIVAVLTAVLDSKGLGHEGSRHCFQRLIAVPSGFYRRAVTL